MKKHNHIQYTISLLLLTGLFSMGTSAAVVDGTHWVIEPGDTLYKIARTLFPGNTLKQTQLRKELISQNPQIFKSGANSISVGNKLLLPSFAAAVKKSENPAPAKLLVTEKTQSIAKVEPVKKAKITSTTTNNPKEVIGQVVINVGELSAENRGNRRQLNRRSKILRGDTISTGKQSITQIRLKDGALLSLRPYTNMKIAEYHYNGRQDGTEQSIIELLKGGFRTITGAIGHINKQNYQVRTSVATIGIRGTHYSLVLCDANCLDDSGNKVKAGLYGGVSDGAVVVKNKTGTHRFNNDEFFQILSERAEPIRFLMPPGVLKNAPKDIAESKDKKKKRKNRVSDKANSGHRRVVKIFEPNQPELAERPSLIGGMDSIITQTSITPQKAPDGSAMLIGFNNLDSNGLNSGTATPVIVSGLTDNEIYLTDELPDITLAGKVPLGIKEFSIDPVLGTYRHDIVMVSADGVPAKLVPSSLGGNALLGVNWGRWNGEFTALENDQQFETSNDLHFIYSENLTTPAQLGGLGGVAVYSMSGGTLPTDNAGNVALAGGTTIAMSVDFSNSQIDSYTVSTNINSIDYQGKAANILFTDLDRSFALGGTVGCTGCTGEAGIVFTGDVAQGALNSYAIENTATATSATGAALLTR